MIKKLFLYCSVKFFYLYITFWISWNPIYVNMFDAKHISIRRAVTDSLIKGKISRNNRHSLQINCPQSEMRQIVESLKTLELNLSLDKSNNL